ncbi:AAA domain-containing protein [Halopseudomonas formosensis]|uniref:AAA domain-containing protein n=1 Tax=Halopseudomonas formosensis TaxID=1002526 RepID=A0A1I6C7G5_9GAMM|nr:AAA family ATPase [Halopseudomonas formosensis]SFQ89117.1 AAA domain-containing protein [Halopseudomonas formosensis]
MLTSRDVLVIDEAGMVGTRQLERVLSHAAEAGAKVVLVGDPQQLQSIEAGAAFRSIHDRHGGVEIHEVRRQREDWQRDATRDRMREAGDLGEDMRVTVERGERSFAAGDRVMFLPDGTSSINRSPCPSNQRSDETDFHFPFDPPLGRHFKTAPRA